MYLDKIIDVIASQMNIPKENITRDSSFKEDIGADSLDIFEIINTLEEEFGLEFSNEDAESIKTVGQAADYIQKAINK